MTIFFLSLKVGTKIKRARTGKRLLCKFYRTYNLTAILHIHTNFTLFSFSKYNRKFGKVTAMSVFQYRY